MLYGAWGAGGKITGIMLVRSMFKDIPTEDLTYEAYRHNQHKIDDY